MNSYSQWLVNFFFTSHASPRILTRRVGVMPCAWIVELSLCCPGLISPDFVPYSAVRFSREKYLMLTDCTVAYVLECLSSGVAGCFCPRLPVVELIINDYTRQTHIVGYHSGTNPFLFDRGLNKHVPGMITRCAHGVLVAARYN